MQFFFLFFEGGSQIHTAAKVYLEYNLEFEAVKIIQSGTKSVEDHSRRHS